MNGDNGNTDSGFFDGVIGGGIPRINSLRSDLPPRDLFTVKSALDRRIARLVMLHPTALQLCSETNLASLEESFKERQLENIMEVLGIQHLRT